MRNKSSFDKIKYQELLVSKLLSSDSDTVWKTAIEIGDFVVKQPEFVWQFVLVGGSSENKDTRAAVATCILEHILQYHFNRYFLRIESEFNLGNKNLSDTFLICSKFGQSNRPENSKKWDILRNRIIRQSVENQDYGDST